MVSKLDFTMTCYCTEILAKVWVLVRHRDAKCFKTMERYSGRDYDVRRLYRHILLDRGPAFCHWSSFIQSTSMSEAMFSAPVQLALCYLYRWF